MSALPGEMHCSTDLSPTSVLVDIAKIGTDLRFVAGDVAGRLLVDTHAATTALQPVPAV